MKGSTMRIGNKRNLNRWLKLRNGERGATLVEYALLVALIALVCIAAVTTFGTAVDSSMTNSTTSMFGP
jgi:Flp pilus assembly pilin Flp